MILLRFLDLEDQFLTLNLMRERSRRSSSQIQKDFLEQREKSSNTEQQACFPEIASRSTNRLRGQTFAPEPV
jgi:hypothetical protein